MALNFNTFGRTDILTVLSSDSQVMGGRLLLRCLSNSTFQHCTLRQSFRFNQLHSEDVARREVGLCGRQDVKTPSRANSTLKI